MVDNESSSSYETDSDESDIWMSLQPEIIVKNDPMYIVHLKKEKKSKCVIFFDYFKSFTQRWFSHILLFLVLVGYGCFGAWIFLMIEGKAEIEFKEPVVNIKHDIKSEYWQQARVKNRDKFILDQLFDIRMNELERQLIENFKSGIEVEVLEEAWTFWDALFYCVTIFTTIGYGHLKVNTDLGRSFTILYALIGIPLVFMVLADFGKLLTRIIKTVYKYMRKVFYARRLTPARQYGRRATIVLTQNVSGAFRSVQRRISSSNSISNKSEASGSQLTVPKFRDRSNSSESRLSSPKNTAETNKVKTTSATPPSAYVESRPGDMSPQSPEPYEVDDEFDLPISIALLILMIYMFCGSFIFVYTDNWNLFEAFYFIFISLSTVGFGDYVPADSFTMVLSSIYLFFGLSLTSMCINVVQERLSHTLNSAKLHIGARIGLDVETIAANGQQVNETKNDQRDAGKEIGFTLKSTDLGENLRKRRERQKSQSREPV